MSNNNEIKSIKDKLSQSAQILVVFGQQASVDHVAAGLSLYLLLKEQGKDVTIATPTEMRAEFSRLVGLDHIKNEISNRDLVISFENYDFDSIEKVSHNDGVNNRFELIIQPKSSKKAPDSKNVSFYYRGAEAQLIFTIGLSKLEDLGSIYESERGVFSKATVVAFNRRQEPNYAAVNILNKEASSLSEIVAEFLEDVDQPAKNDSASNLLAGIDFATNRFQNPLISANAFITAGKLIQNGAKRQPPRVDGNATVGAPAGNFMPFVPPSPVNQPQFNRPQNGRGLGKPNSNNQDRDGKNPPQDWLKPKIYTGASRV